MIRPADPARDGAACAAIYEPHVRDSAVSFEEEPPDAAEMGRRIERLARTHAWLVLERDGRIAGYAYGAPHRERAAYRWATETSVYVAGEATRTGVGRRLYDELLRLLAARGYHVALAGITLPNPASVAFHEALGFQPVGVYRSIGWKAGGWRDVGWWQLALRPGDEEPPADPATAR